MILVVIALFAVIPLLGLMTFVQILYLESLRLRTRDLPSLKFFKETLEDRIGLKTEDGAGAFSLVKHSLLSVVGILYFAWFADGAPLARGGLLAGHDRRGAHHDRGLLCAARNCSTGAPAVTGCCRSFR